MTNKLPRETDEPTQADIAFWYADQFWEGRLDPLGRLQPEEEQLLPSGENFFAIMARKALEPQTPKEPPTIARKRRRAKKRVKRADAAQGGKTAREACEAAGGISRRDGTPDRKREAPKGRHLENLIPNQN